MKSLIMKFIIILPLLVACNKKAPDRPTYHLPESQHLFVELPDDELDEMFDDLPEAEAEDTAAMEEE